MEKLSIIIPCYNEESGINNLFVRLDPILGRLANNWELEVVFVDDGSKDKTFELLQEYFGNKSYVKIIKHSVNKNLGEAIRTGFSNATGDVIVTLDSDCTYDPIHIEDLLGLLEDSDIVTASPYHPEGLTKNVPKYRLFLSRSITTAYRLLTGSKIHTFTALFRAYKREVIDNINFKSSDFLANAEILIKALDKGYRVNEYPTTLGRRSFGDSKMKLMSVIFSHFRFASGLLFLKLFKSKSKNLLK